VIHYHGTPISPVSVLYTLAGRSFCVSHAVPRDVERVHQIGQSVLLDNGAFSKWKRDADTDWPAFYAWCERWLHYPTTWAVIPDVIGEGGQVQDMLLREWPFGHRGAPVWHMDENLDRLLRLCDEWPRVCIGSTAEFRDVLSPAWEARMDEAFNALAQRHRFTPWVHMLRGLACCGKRWPFASADSTNLAQSHRVSGSTAATMVQRMDAVQTPGRWMPREAQLELPAPAPLELEAPPAPRVGRLRGSNRPRVGGLFP
jgi:hypothetical protein